ncbi:hypothetical protein AMTR_s00036p00210210 [Amborella trichopoda]|uniref:Ribosomal eL28/Mak16 domain-containing protein n=2 Tax=Amborella trichopoda TaxID=13333 RepID=U5CZI8_AMBTC|nr:hypothetical protein AMTR_s00036p00210210 [Amborella trichopoda]
MRGILVIYDVNLGFPGVRRSYKNSNFEVCCSSLWGVSKFAKGEGRTCDHFLLYLINTMATLPGPLIWEIVKKNNSFFVKQFGNGSAMVQFSKESNNLYNVHSFKYSGLANKKTVSITPGGKDLSVALSTTKTRKQSKPSDLQNRSLLKKEFRRMAKAVVSQVADNYYRPDLKDAALARLSAVHRSLKVAKSGVKKKTRQNQKPSRK